VPLIVLTPKSLLRHPFVVSTPADLSEGKWQAVIDDVEAQRRRADVTRLLLCSGKIAVDLFTSDARKTHPATAICRVEQLYPFPEREIAQVIGSYPSLAEIVWVQEEPENMGACDFVRPRLQVLAGKTSLRVLARPRSSSPAEGSSARHAANQERLIAQAFAMKGEK
jgi:2-oxoglutarate dehydrogenase E1 component